MESNDDRVKITARESTDNEVRIASGDCVDDRVKIAAREFTDNWVRIASGECADDRVIIISIYLLATTGVYAKTCRSIDPQKGTAAMTR
jgi:hypothetical protein